MRSIAAIVLLCVAVVSANAADDPRATYLELARKERYGEAIESLQKLAASRRVERWLLVVDLARIQRLAQSPKDAIKTLEELREADRDRPEVAIELARCHAAIGDADMAAELLSLNKEHAEPEIRCYTGYEMARLDYAAQRYEACVTRCEGVLKEFELIRLEEDYGGRVDEPELRALQAEARDLLAKVKDELTSLQYGNDYAHYRAARIAQAQGRFADAIERYRKIQAPVLKDAALCYVPACLVGLGETAKAMDLYQAFVDDEAFGLYRGEARLEIAKVRVLHARSRGDLEAAAQALGDVTTWLADVDQHAPSSNAAGLEALLKAFRVPEQFAGLDRLGNYYRHHVAPETVVNRLTCRWYLPHLRTQADLLRGFVLAELDRHQEAASLLGGVARHTSAGRYGAILNVDDLPDRLPVDAGDGAFILPPSLWRVSSSEHAVRTHLGFFYTAAGEWDAARKLLQGVSDATGKGATQLSDHALAELGLAYLDFAEKRDDAAVARLRKFDNALQRSPVTPLAQTILANVLAARKDFVDPTGKKHTGGYEEAKLRYTAVATAHARTEFAPRALLCLAVAAHNRGHTGDARHACDLLKARYGDTTFAQAADTLRRLIDGDVAASESASSDQPLGRVVSFTRHLTIPGNFDMACPLGGLAPGDLLDYRLNVTVRTGCAVHGFRWRLTPLEPQITPTNETSTAFVRAPVLITTAEPSQEKQR